MKNDVIEINPNKVSGTSVFAGTRVPIKNIFDYLEGGETLEDSLGGNLVGKEAYYQLSIIY